MYYQTTKTMTKQGLNDLKELSTEVDELRKKAGKLMVSLMELYHGDEEVEAREAFEELAKAAVSMQEIAWRLGYATEETQKAYKFEKAYMDYHEGLLNKLHNDTARTE